jgi:hypothetical protein
MKFLNLNEEILLIPLIKVVFTFFEKKRNDLTYFIYVKLKEIPKSYINISYFIYT